MSAGLYIAAGFGGLLWLLNRKPAAPDAPLSASRQVPPTPAQPLPPVTTATAPAQNWIGAMQRYIGAYWVKGGIGPAGFDCSGLGWRGARDIGLSIPRTVQDMYMSMQYLSEDQARQTPGALVIFRENGNFEHVEYSVGNGYQVIASEIKNGVKLYPWDWWRGPKFINRYRIDYGILPQFLPWVMGR